MSQWDWKQTTALEKLKTDSDLLNKYRQAWRTHRVGLGQSQISFSLRVSKDSVRDWVRNIYQSKEIADMVR